MPNGIQVSCCSVRITDQKFITYIYKYWRFFFYPKLFPVLLLYYCIVYVNLFKDRSSWCPPFLSESGCKGKEFFVYPPNFCGTFFEVFFSKLGFELHFSKAGAKVGSYFQTTKCFEKFFFESFFESLRGKELSAWASLMRKAGKPSATKGQLHQKSPATACQVSPLRFRKRVQKYSLFR